MLSRAKFSTTTTFEAEHVIQPIYTGGDVALDKTGHILATCLGEETVITDIRTGALLARVEAVGSNTAIAMDELTKRTL